MTEAPMKQPLVIVTGATRGLGLAIAERLLKDGYRVVGTGRTCSEAILELSEKYHGLLQYEFLDLNDTAELHGVVSRITTRHGHLYGLVNNAALGYDGILATMHESQINEIIRVNVEAPILMAKYCARSMLLARRGRIINISSIIATTGFSGLSVYAATKAALSGFTRSLGRELGKAGITVNTVAPGYMQTDMTQELRGEKLESIRRRSPLGKLASVEDVAGSVSYLMSPDAERITGITITVDAGSTA